MNGNWASLYMTQRLGASTTLASLALTIFWGTVTAGRILFAAIGRWVSEYLTYQALPFVVAAAFVAVAFIPKSDPFLGILAFGLAGLGCSALLPLTISFGQKELTAIAASVPGGLIAFYQMGYGIAAFGVGPLQQKAGLSLSHHLRLRGDCGTGHGGAILCRNQASDRACAERPLRTNMKTSLIPKDLARRSRNQKRKMDITTKHTKSTKFKSIK